MLVRLGSPPDDRRGESRPLKPDGNDMTCWWMGVPVTAPQPQGTALRVKAGNLPSETLRCSAVP
jgi:hypothetical protein